ncbi:MAG: hypothetical protein E7813_18440 [Bradyrhizobium sp.]|uniref:hypothetical protein n=1 Tax=Bradyrhizobium sp. TaxID=376 RepID=UPI001225A7A2|nr:hypothetical protein [Bradyrhizobium sp.]THD63404.1 MAG: hypothetical protein E7813_18440 [Bradyrhizobium sp.]
MTYFRPSQERAHVTKRFLTAREVEDIAAAGAVEIVQVDGLVITDAARETAQDLGLRIKQPQRQAEQERKPSERNSPPEAPQRVEIGATPASMGHVVSARLAGGRPGTSGSRGAISVDPLLQALVQAVRSNRPRLAALAQGD